MKQFTLPKKKENKPKSSKKKSQRNKTKSRPINASVDHILHLQQTIGNQAVQRMIKSGTLQLKDNKPHSGDVYSREIHRLKQRVEKNFSVTLSHQKTTLPDSQTGQRPKTQISYQLTTMSDELPSMLNGETHTGSKSHGQTRMQEHKEEKQAIGKEVRKVQYKVALEYGSVEKKRAKQHSKYIKEKGTNIKQYRNGKEASKPSKKRKRSEEKRRRSKRLRQTRPYPRKRDAYKTAPRYGENKKYSGGTSMEVELQSGTLRKGSKPSVMKTILDKLNKEYSKGNWKRGHLLNEKLGGYGETQNLTMLTGSANTSMTRVENKLNSLMELLNNLPSNHDLHNLSFTYTVKKIGQLGDKPPLSHVGKQITMQVKDTTESSAKALDWGPYNRARREYAGLINTPVTITIKKPTKSEKKAQQGRGGVVGGRGGPKRGGKSLVWRRFGGRLERIQQ